ncbi:MAG: efflux RND transporter permease subunit [Alphaproteobacteria bacterium]|nr:efflux RND transporter permease subunit [Alphaproteobacteria bacterium]MCB9792089.1 efflux RND transporter permease subunit [Alphaproteobacteria bacterium]
MLVLGGLMVSPFDLELGDLPRDPVPVDAIPDLGDNQQIVFTEWPGRSPRDVEDQITYPLTTALLGIPGVRTVRSSSALGFSSVYVIFNDEVDYWFSRTRVLEKLSALPPNLLPDDVTPTLGPDATALGQVFWYTLEGQDAEGNTVGGWDPDELRAIQDWDVRYALQSVEGVSEVSSIGGHVREWQVDVDPEALRAHGVSLGQVADAVRRSNLDVGARTLEVNGVEYLIRSLGFVRDAEDLEQAVVVARGDTPIRVSDLARVSLGPGLRRGALDDAGAPAVGGVVVARTQENPKAVIEGVKERIAKLQPSLPRRTLEDGTEAQVTLVPFYDRSVLIEETLGTLSTALGQQLLITALVVLVMLQGLRSSLLISALLPLGVLGTFVVMKLTGVDANIMALGGVAIAIGAMVDIGIVFVENVEQHLAARAPEASAEDTVRRAAAEVAPAVVTSVLTTVVSFLPVFGLTAQELRLFGPLAFTKTFAMGVALLMALVVVPGAALLVLRRRGRVQRPRLSLSLALGAGALLATWWSPLGPGAGLLLNLLFAGALIAAVLGGFALFERAYPRLLAWVLDNKARFLVLPVGIIAFGLLAWLGADGLTARLPEGLRAARPVVALTHAFPGLDREYMPPFDEGAFLYMPTTPPHASLGEVLDMLSEMDAAIAQIPEVDRVVGKLGRADSALDPAPVSMIETLVTYHPEYRTEPDGRRVRQWRDHVRSPQDIWTEITRAAQGPGLTSAPPLMPISTRLVMLRSGMRAPMGIKVTGPDLESIERFGLDLEALLRQAPAIQPETVFADRVVGKPYLEIELDREAIARHGLRVVDVQEVLQVALGGMPLSRAIEGRERTPIRVRYMREARDSVEALERVFVSTPGGAQVPLGQLAELRYARGPQVIKSEDTFLTSYVLFDRAPEVSELDAVEQAEALVAAHLADGRLVQPEGVRYTFAGTYEDLLRSERRLKLLIPVALSLVFILLYLQFRRAAVAAIIYSGVAVAVGGAFSLLWLYGRPGFLDLELMGASLQALFHVGPTKLSVAVWVGVIALIGLATDDGVVMSTYLDQVFRDRPPVDLSEVRARTLEAGMRRVRPCLMTTATTLLALLPVITSQGRGSDVMVPMALPMVGGMAVELVTLFVVPVLWCALEERRLSPMASAGTTPGGDSP